MSSLDVLYAGLSATSGSEIITPDTAKARIDAGMITRDQIKEISIDQVFEHTYPSTQSPIIKFSLSDQMVFDESPWIDIKVKTLTGMIIEVKVNVKFTIAQVKTAIEEQDRTLPADRQKLVYNLKQLSDDETVEGLGISDGNTICLVLLLRGGGKPRMLVLPPNDFLHPEFDYDFTKMNDTNTGDEFWRGEYNGQPLRYYRPCGWYRHALKVQGKYGNDDSWLGQAGLRKESSSGEWPVAYHGVPTRENVQGIIQEGFISTGEHGQKFGRGVYTSPNLQHVEDCYAKAFSHNDKVYKIVFQNRVNTAPGHLKIVQNANDFEGVDYWVSTKHNVNAGVVDVRPYGVLIKELTKKENNSCLLQ